MATHLKIVLLAYLLSVIVLMEEVKPVLGKRRCKACSEIEGLDTALSELKDKVDRQQDPSKPSAHIEAANKQAVTYQANQVIKDWSVSAPYSHLAGGMTYNDGKLTVPTSGRYYIYVQLYYHSNGRVLVYVNDKVITMIQPPTAGSDHGTLYAGGVFNLKAGDVISLITGSSVTIYMYSFHSYFGAFLI